MFKNVMKTQKYINQFAFTNYNTQRTQKKSFLLYLTSKLWYTKQNKTKNDQNVW